jgi:hypothetical protein
VIHDLFHVVAKYGRKVIDGVRFDETNRLRQDKPACKVITEWLTAIGTTNSFFMKFKNDFPGNPLKTQKARDGQRAE